MHISFVSFFISRRKWCIVAENGDYSGPKRRQFSAIVVALPDYYSRQCGQGFWRYIIMADSIRDSIRIRIRIVTPDSIRYSIRMQKADSQVPTF